MAKIGILTTPVATERNVEHLIFRIAEILAREHEVHLIGLAQASDRLKAGYRIFAPPELRRVPFYLAWARPLAYRLRMLNAFVRAERPDVLMAVSSIGLNGLAVAIAGRRWRIPAIARVTSDVFVVSRFAGPLSRRVPLYIKNNILGRLTMRLATRVIVLHESQGEDLARHGFDARKFVAIPQPVVFPQTPTPEAVQELRARLGIPAGAPVAGIVGRVDEDKNPDFLIGVVRKVWQRDPSVHFLIVGEGNAREKLSHALADPRAIFTGQQPRDALAAYYLLCDVLLNTSHSEGLSTAIAEALYFGKPVIVTDSGTITRALVSNIVHSEEEMAEMIVRRTARRDTLPEAFAPAANAALYLKLISAVTAGA